MSAGKVRYSAMVIVLLFISQEVFALSARQIIQKSENAIRGNSTVGLYEITIRTRRWKRTMKLKSWDNRTRKRSFSEITAPKKDAGNRFLLINKSMRQYIPKLQKDIKISPSMMMQSWMGSDFTNDDIVKESSILDDYSHRLLGMKNISGFDCYRVELKPEKGADVVWGKIIYYARKKDCLPVREEFYNEHDVLKKVMTFSKYRKMHGRIIPAVMKMQTVRKKDRYTVMEIKNIVFNVKIPSRVFSIQNLKRR